MQFLGFIPRDINEVSMRLPSTPSMNLWKFEIPSKKACDFIIDLKVNEILKLAQPALKLEFGFKQSVFYNLKKNTFSTFFALSLIPIVSDYFESWQPLFKLQIPV